MGYGSQSGQEPISGQTGEGTASQPYDAGNIEGQSGAPASGATSTNPTGTTQYDTGDTSRTSQINTTTYDKEGSSGLKPSENLTAGVTSDESTANTSGETSGESRFNDTNEGAVSKGTDQGQGPDEAVTSRGGPSSDENTTAQDTFFSNAGISKDEKAAPPKVASEVADKDPFSSSSSGGGVDTSTTRAETSNTPSAPTISSNDNNLTSSSSGGLDKVSSSAPEKSYKAADTEPHPHSSEVLSSATPGAAIGSSYGSSEPQSQTTGSGISGNGYDDTLTFDASGAGAGSGSGYDNNTSSTTTGGGTTTASGYDHPSTLTSIPGGTSSAYNNDSTTTNTTAAAADTDYPSPKTQPTESQGGLSGISHNTGSAPTAPATGNQAALEDPALGASQGQEKEKKKIGDRIKEKLHIGGKKDS
ncbi:MAG: hypothetical protein L6R37_002927 [Teloschistes peruensis]|nr:MAG: hypothetical protein L6R37_002927 [Teloschistes peruensis]